MPRYLVSLLVLFLFVSVVPGHSQLTPSGGENLCTLRVDVATADKGKPVVGVRVQLLQGLAGLPYGIALTNSTGSAQFEGLMPGDYRVEVSGEGIEATTSQLFRFEMAGQFLSEQVAVRVAADDKTGAGNSVNVHQLNVPAEASQEVVRGDQEMQQKHWKEAADHYNKAVTIYPQYPLGYYNLSVAYLQLQQTDKQRDALQKALSIDDHFVPALIGLAHVKFAYRQLPETRSLLESAITADPTNVEALALLVRVDYMQGQYEATIADAKRVHSLPHDGYATVHYTAAAAYQQLNRIPEMISELKIYLKEDPTSSNASYVRQEIVELGGKPD